MNLRRIVKKMTDFNRSGNVRRKKIILIILAVILVLVAGWYFNSVYKSGESKKTWLTDLKNNPLVKEEEIAFEKVKSLMYTDPDSARNMVYHRLEIIDPQLKEIYEMVYNNILGSTYLFQTNYTQALNAYHRTLELALEYNSPIHISNAYNNIGALNIVLGNFKDALDFLRKALELNEKLNQIRDISSSQNNIGRIYFELNDLNMAKQYFLLAYEGFKANDNLIGVSSVASNLAQYYLKIEAPDSAYHFFLEAISLGLESDNNFGLASTYREFGDFLLEEERFDQSLFYYIKSDSLSRQIESKSNVVSALLGLAQVYLTMGQTTPALSKVNEASDIAYELNDEKLIYEATHLLAEVYEKKDDIQAALDYFKQAEALKQNMEKHSEHVQVYNLEIQRLIDSVADKEREIEREKLLADRRKVVVTAVIILLALAIIILSLIYYIYLDRIKQKQKDRENENRIRHSTEKTQAVMIAEMNERKRLSAELHDGIGPLLSLSKVNISNILEKNEMDTGKKKNLLHNTQKNIEEVLREIKNISNNVSPKILTEKGFAEALKELTLRLVQLRKFEIGLSINGLANSYKPYVEHALYRTVQEVLNNVVNHSECSELNIHVLQDKDELTIMLEDNGKGFDPSDLNGNQGMGLKNASYRIESLGGQFFIDSLTGRGTIITLIVPINTL
ncbi:MAG: sensor histidine kinase [Bacteroidales bacterium]|jgi:signal transduction histidine kinase|nr:sensor histidine kinase [Bacteroidales bacterium]